jgi:hypothetical protein
MIEIPKWQLAITERQHQVNAEASALSIMLENTDDHWAATMALAEAQFGGGNEDAALTASMAHHVAVSMLASLSMQLNKRLQVFYGWEMMDESSVITVGDEGFVALHGVLLDDSRDAGLVLITEKHLDEPETFPPTVLRYCSIYKAQINMEPCEWEGMAPWPS